MHNKLLAVVSALTLIIATTGFALAQITSNTSTTSTPTTTTTPTIPIITTTTPSLPFTTPSTTPTSTADILAAVRTNLQNVQTLNLSGAVNTTVDASAFADNLFFRWLTPNSWQTFRGQVGFNFTGMIDKSANPVASSWTLSNFSASSTPSSSTVGMSSTHSSSTVEVVTQGTTVYFTADTILNFLAGEGLISNSSTNLVKIDIPKLADELGLQSLYNEKKTMIVNAFNNPGQFFTVTRLDDMTLNGVDSYHFRIRGNKAFLDMMYPQSVNGGFNRSGRGDLFVSKATLLPERVTFTARLQGRVGRPDNDRFNLTLNFDQFNSPATVTVPSPFRTVENVLTEVFQSLISRFGITTVTTTPVTPTTTTSTTMGMPTSTPVSPSTTTSTPTTTASAISIAGLAFNPANLAVSAGTTVTWTNNDSVSHTVTADNGTFDSGVIPPGGTYSHTFTAAGTVTYHCTIHPFMHGSVIAQ